MRQGDVHWADFPVLEGHEQSGRRPCILIQADSYSEHLSTVVVIPLTTNQRAQRFPGAFLIEPDSDNGLANPSVALVFQVQVVDKRRIGRRIGTLRDADYDRLVVELNRLAERGRDAHPL